MLKLEIVTPEKKVFDAEVEEVVVPTASGEAGILSNHAPLISSLKPGILSYFGKNISEKLAVSGGFVEVNNNKVSVMIQDAATASEIDVEKESKKREVLEKELLSSGANIEANEKLIEQIEFTKAKIALAMSK